MLQPDHGGLTSQPLGMAPFPWPPKESACFHALCNRKEGTPRTGVFHGPQGKARALLSDLSLEKPKVVYGRLSKSFTPHVLLHRSPDFWATGRHLHLVEESGLGLLGWGHASSLDLPATSSIHFLWATDSHAQSGKSDDIKSLTSSDCVIGHFKDKIKLTSWMNVRIILLEGKKGFKALFFLTLVTETFCHISGPAEPQEAEEPSCPKSHPHIAE